MPTKHLTLKDMTIGSGCTPRTVRYYERQGLLSAVRSAGGHRLFSPVELERLEFIISLREAGWSLEEVMELFAVRDQRESDHDCVKELETLIASHIDRLERKMDVLRRLRADLQATTRLLTVCSACTRETQAVHCEECERIPRLPGLPKSFRLSWRARELGGAGVFDEMAADVADGGDEGV